MLENALEKVIELERHEKRQEAHISSYICCQIFKASITGSPGSYDDKFTIVKLLIVYYLCVLFVALLHCFTSALYCIIVRMREFDTKFLAGVLYW